MTPSELQFMRDNRIYADAYNGAGKEGPRIQMPMKNREELERITRKHLEPGMVMDKWCSDCVRSYILNAYQLFNQYETKQHSIPGAAQKLPGRNKPGRDGDTGKQD